MTSSFSVSQQTALALVPKFTGVLSLLSSAWIAVEIVTVKSKRQNVYNRLLLAMSVMDIAGSSCFFASTWPIPTGTPGVVFALGNRISCRAQGFVLQLAVVSPLYNTCLSVYYLLVVRFAATEDTLKRRVEPAMHLFCWSAGIMTALASLLMDNLHEADLWCWIGSIPIIEDDNPEFPYCSVDEPDLCPKTGQTPNVYRMAFFFFPLWACIFLTSIMIVIVYKTIRGRELSYLQDHAEVDADGKGEKAVISGRPSMEPRRGSLSQSFRQFSVSSSEFARKDIAQSFRSNDFKSNLETVTEAEPGPGKGNNANPQTERRRSSWLVPRQLTEGNVSTMNLFGGGNLFGHEEKSKERPSMRRSINQGTRESPSQRQLREDRAHIMDVIEALPSVKEQATEANAFGSRAVYEQSLFYTLAFWLTFTPATINRVVQMVTGNTYFPIILLHVIFIPTQGLFNALIYRRNAYIALTQRYPHMPYNELMKRVWRWSFLGPPKGAEEDEKKFGKRITSKTSSLLASLRTSFQPKTSRNEFQDQNESVDEDMNQIGGSVPERSRQDSTLVSNNDELNFQDTIADDVYGGADGDFVDYMAAATLATYGDFPDALNSGSVAVSTNFSSYDDGESEAAGAGGGGDMPHAFPTSFPSMLDGSFQNN